VTAAEWIPSIDIGLARRLDAEDPLAPFRQEFLIPNDREGKPQTYLVGNSLGLAPKGLRDAVTAELDRWADLGVAGHFTGETAWASIHELLTEPMAALVGAEADEVVVMNSLTVNLHLLMISFYTPTPQRHKILIEAHAFPSDHFAVESQIRQRGFDPAGSLEVIAPRPGEETLRAEDIVATIEHLGDELALVLLPGVQYFTGQVLAMDEITEVGHRVGALVGFDLAHAAGNVELALHDWDVDFAAWCSYKYLNSGAGGVAGTFVNRRHITDTERPKFLGWWGTRKDTRFEMSTVYEPIPTAESWQVSNPSMLTMAALRASLDVFQRAGGMGPLRAKSERQVTYLDQLLEALPGNRVISLTPKAMAERGCQFALRITDPNHEGKKVFAALEEQGVAADWREPDVIRVAPVPLYNSFEDIHRFVTILDGVLS